MSLTRYPEYKEAKISWLDEMPSHWRQKRLRFAACLNPSKAKVRRLDPDALVSFLPMEAVGEDGSLRLEKLRRLDEVIDGYTYFEERDVGIAKITPCFENGKAAIMEGLRNSIGFGTTELTILRAEPGIADPKFLYRLVTSEPFRRLGESEMYGAGGQKRVPDDFVRNFRFALPPMQEQQKIAEFIDHEATRIDALIEEQQRLIELLKEKRQAVISHAVAKGLNPDVPMKDSEVEWLGEVPAHWDVLPLKRVVAEPLMYGANEAAEHDDPRHPRFVRITDVTEDGGLRDETFRSLPPDVAAPYLLEEGDLLLARSGATVGKSFMYRNSWGKCCFAGYLIRARVDREKAMAEFINMSLKSHGYWLYIGQQQIQATIQNVSAERYESYLVAIPPLDEQLCIVEFLNKALRKYSTLMETAQQSIDFLQERRSALISAAVTGKIDVRGWQPPPGSPTPNETTATEPA